MDRTNDILNLLLLASGNDVNLQGGVQQPHNNSSQGACIGTSASGSGTNAALSIAVQQQLLQLEHEQQLQLQQQQQVSSAALIQQYLQQQQQEQYMQQQQQQQLANLISADAIQKSFQLREVLAPANQMSQTNGSNTAPTLGDDGSANLLLLQRLQEMLSYAGGATPTVTAGPQVALNVQQQWPYATAPVSSAAAASSAASASSSEVSVAAGQGRALPFQDVYSKNGLLGPWSANSAGVLGKLATKSKTALTDAKARKVRKKPKDKPKRPLSAYNIFFKEERQRILEQIPGSEEIPTEVASPTSSKRKKNPHGKISFESLAKAIGQRWQDLSSEKLDCYKKKAGTDKLRYTNEMNVFTSMQLAKRRKIVAEMEKPANKDYFL